MGAMEVGMVTEVNMDLEAVGMQLEEAYMDLEEADIDTVGWFARLLLGCLRQIRLECRD